MLRITSLFLVFIAGCGRLGFQADDPPDAPSDASMFDAALDAAVLDAPLDAAPFDAALDAAMFDAGTDAGADASITDAGTDAGADAGVPPSPCPGITGTWTLSAPVALTALNSASSDNGTTLSADGLTLYFASDRGGGTRDIYRSTRTSLASAWSAPVLESGVSSALEDSQFAVMPDGLTALVDRAGASADVLLGSRSSPGAAWGTFTAIPALSTMADEWDPRPSTDGLRIVLTVLTLPGGPGGRDLAISTRAAVGMPFGAPVPLPGIDTAGNESAPALSDDERFLVFVDEDSGDLYYATRPDTASPFGARTPLPVVNGASIESDSALSTVGCELYFSSTRGGSPDLYRSVFVPR